MMTGLFEQMADACFAVARGDIPQPIYAVTIKTPGATHKGDIIAKNAPEAINKMLDGIESQGETMTITARRNP